MRAAAIDIGTNTVLLTIAEAATDAPRPVHEQAVITRLGESVDATGILQSAAIDRTVRCLGRLRQEIDRHQVDLTDVVCTSAARDAANAIDFLDAAQAALGVRPRIISGEDEARLTFAGSQSGLPFQTGPVCVFDVGGGSTEVIAGQNNPAGPRVDRVSSFDIGSVRLTERFLTSDPPTATEVALTRRWIHECLAVLPASPAEARWVGVAGTVTTLKTLELELEVYAPSRVHGSTLTSDSVSARLKRLLCLTSAERARLPGLEPARADVIVAGALIVEAILARAEAPSCLVSDRGVRWGLVAALLTGRAAIDA